MNIKIHFTSNCPFNCNQCTHIFFRKNGSEMQAESNNTNSKLWLLIVTIFSKRSKTYTNPYEEVRINL